MQLLLTIKENHIVSVLRCLITTNINKTVAILAQWSFPLTCANTGIYLIYGYRNIQKSLWHYFLPISFPLG